MDFKKMNKLRGFDAAKYERTLSNWGLTQSANFNEELQSDLEVLRNRSREASLNNEYLRRYLKALKTNVVGPTGFKLKNKALNTNNSLDRFANKKIETAWEEWSQNAGIEGESLTSLSHQLFETTARDGESLIVFRRGPQFGKYQFQIQLLEAEYLYLNNTNDSGFKRVSGGKNIKNGVELDSYGRPVAYWLWTTHPKERLSASQSYENLARVSSSDMIHLFDKERPAQLRGFPWTTPVLIALQHISEYRKSELIASRAASGKMGFYTRPKGEDPHVGDEEDLTDEHAFISESEPGHFEVLPEGYNLTTYDPQNPNGQFQAFVKTILRGVASGLGVNYHTLSGDLESTSYSSLRWGALDERETWKYYQLWFEEQLLNKVFSEWLRIALYTQAIALPSDGFSKFNKPIWRGRTWNFIDPAKEVVAVSQSLDRKIKSMHEVITDSTGRDFEDVMREIAEEKQFMETLGLGNDVPDNNSDPNAQNA